MFSVIFPGQGSQNIGMAKEFYDNFDYIKEIFNKADDVLKIKISKIILEGPKEILDQTENTQPAIFLVSYSIFKVLQKETNFNINNAKYFAGHSLGEYSALCCAESINFDQTLNILKYRGKAMQQSVPKGQGGMIAILGLNSDEFEKILQDNEELECYIANDNTVGQIVASGKIESLKKIKSLLISKNVKHLELPVSAPFHCPLMRNATEQMTKIINNTEFKKPEVDIISNVTANPMNDPKEIKKLLIKQIESRVRWRESIINMINLGTDQFIEVGPGKILSGLVKRIDRKIKINQVNNLIDIKNLTND